MLLFNIHCDLLHKCTTFLLPQAKKKNLLPSTLCYYKAEHLEDHVIFPTARTNSNRIEQNEHEDHQEIMSNHGQINL